MERILDVRGIEERRAVVTGCAGFIGSHLCERLVADGYRGRRHRLVQQLLRSGEQARQPRIELADEPDFELVEMNLASADLRPVMASAPLVFHIAGQPGVRASFGDSFALYASDNIVATQRVFDAAAAAGCERVVWASSSSVYGDAATYPCVEATTPTLPRSPYGVTKRACEDLASVYRQQGLIDRWPPVLHRLRSAATPRHGDPPDLRGPRERSPVLASSATAPRRATSPTCSTSSRPPCSPVGHRSRTRSTTSAAVTRCRSTRSSPFSKQLAGRTAREHPAPCTGRRRPSHRCGHDRGPEFARMATSRGPCDRARPRAELGPGRACGEGRVITIGSPASTTKGMFEPWS